MLHTVLTPTFNIIRIAPIRPSDESVTNATGDMNVAWAP